MIEFAWPFAALLLPLPLIVWALPALKGADEAALNVPSLLPFQSQAHVRAQRHQWPWVLFLCWVLLVAGIARPQWVGEPRPLPTAGRDLLLAVDISGSMGDDDMVWEGVRVTRIDLVKRLLSEFIEARQGDRVGLILFGTRPYVQAPLTFDRQTVAALLLEAPLGIAGGRTAIGDAIGLAVKHLLDRPAESRVLVLLTDGASNTGELTPARAAEIAKDAGIRVHTIGFAGAGTDFFGRLRSRSSSEIDEQSLQQVAAVTGGTYFRAAAGDELQRVYKQIDTLEPSEQDPDTVRPVISFAHVPIALAWCLGCLLLAARALSLRIS
ncbi:MAG: VWA domain-containing protein [Gammaproteobacteria bacterium]|nr:VWA domain-containing protein [Gammaproteobacteria bacterium]